MKTLQISVINFTELQNTSFNVTRHPDDLVNSILAKDDLPEIVRLRLTQRFLSGPQLLDGKDALFASLGQIDLIPKIDGEESITPIDNVSYSFNYECPKFIKLWNTLQQYEIDFLLAYISWRTGEILLSDIDWDVSKLGNAIIKIDHLKFDVTYHQNLKTA
jgi:hypothetical protein